MSPLEGEEGVEEKAARRAVCARCSRPAARDCLCAALPASLLHTFGSVLVLQHPAEQKRTLATVPLLQLCLAKLTVSRGRLFPHGKCASLDAALFGDAALFLLWPSKDALPLEEAVAGLTPGEAYTLVALDGTWRQAREMARPLLSRLVRATRVKLAVDNDASLLLRTEPQAGCVTTAEALARALCILEERSSGRIAAAALQAALLAPLRLLVSLQLSRDAVGKGVKDAR